MERKYEQAAEGEQVEEMEANLPHAVTHFSRWYTGPFVYYMCFEFKIRCIAVPLFLNTQHSERAVSLEKVEYVK